MTDMKSRKLRTLKGFNDYLPEDMRLRNYVINTFIEVYEKYGYEPLETPTLEYADTILGISGDAAEKLMYRFKDKGDRDVIMRYEVMVPMCRVVAQYRHELTFPFKRYQIQRVWRADKPQKGRLREFTQSDADTIGTTSVLADAEAIQMGIEILTKLGFKDFEARISNRKLLYGMLEELSIEKEKYYQTCMAIDDLEKIGPSEVSAKLTDLDISAEAIEKLLNVLTADQEATQLIQLIQKTFSSAQVQEALNETEKILAYLKTTNTKTEKYRFDPSIARGLAHYTGPVWEFSIMEGGVGSVSGGGRYDDLIGNYLGTDEIIPATGGSFGIERMMIILKDRNMVDFSDADTKLLVTIFNNKSVDSSVILAQKARDNNIPTVLYPDPDTNLGDQISYANKKNIPYVAIIGPDEAKDNQVTLKNMKTGDQQTLSVEETISILKPET